MDLFKLSKNRRLFIAITVLALLFNLLFLINQIYNAKTLKTFVATEDAKILDSFMLAFRKVYQEIFIRYHVPLDEANTRLLPVVTTLKISEHLSELLDNKVVIRTVSDRPRNPENLADKLEQKTIDYFRRHPEAKVYKEPITKEGREFFYYASPLYITKRCLVCHGPRDQAPAYIRTHYDKAFDYKLGELRGVIGIYLSQESLKKNIAIFAYKDIAFMIIITLVGLALFAWLLKKYSRQERQHTENLEKEIKIKTREIRWQLYFDDLTGLPNRRSLLEDLQKERAYAIILINIDSFKEINDIYGHEAADRILNDLAQLIRANCSIAKCTLYRMPSDEFAMIIFDVNLTKSTLREHIRELNEIIQSHEFKIDTHTTVMLKITVGASFRHDESLAAADMALKKAKNEHLSFFIYDESMELTQETKRNLEWKKRIDEALQTDRIVPYFQPIISAKNDKVEILEALIRIVETDGTVYTPYHFLEIAKKTRQYPELTRIMVKKSLEAAKKVSCHVSINLSYLDLVNTETVRFIESEIKAFNRPEKIHFEILESEGIKRYEDILETVTHFKKLGCGISLDDFGSGYSNFVHMVKLDANLLKIDGSLIRDIDQDITSQIIVETIVDFAEKLGMNTCAEFVSSQEIYDTVKEYGVDFLQGYHLSAPKTLEEILKEFKEVVI